MEPSHTLPVRKYVPPHLRHLRNLRPPQNEQRQGIVNNEKRDEISGSSLTKSDRRRLLELAKQNIPLLHGANAQGRKKHDEVTKLLADARIVLNRMSHSPRSRLHQICANKGWKVEDCVFCQDKCSPFVEHVLSESHIELMIQRNVYPLSIDCNLILSTLNMVLSSQGAEGILASGDEMSNSAEKRDRRKLIELEMQNIPLLTGADAQKLKKQKEVIKLLADARIMLNRMSRWRRRRLDQICANKGWKADDCVFCKDKCSSFVEHILSQSHIELMIQRKVYPAAADCNLIISTLNMVLSSQDAKKALPSGDRISENQIVSEKVVCTAIAHAFSPSIYVTTTSTQNPDDITDPGPATNEHAQPIFGTVHPDIQSNCSFFSKQECAKNFRNIPLLSGQYNTHKSEMKNCVTVVLTWPLPLSAFKQEEADAFVKLTVIDYIKYERTDVLLADACILLDSVDDDAHRSLLDHICANKGWKAEHCLFCDEKCSRFLEHVLSHDHVEKMLHENVMAKSKDYRLIIGTIKKFITSLAAGKANIMHNPWDVSNQIYQGPGSSRPIHPSASMLNRRRYRLPLFDPYSVVDSSLDITDPWIRGTIDSVWRSKRFRSFSTLLQKKMCTFFSEVNNEGSFLGCDTCQLAFSTWYTLIDHALSRCHIEQMIRSGYCFEVNDFELILSVCKETCLSKKHRNEKNSVAEATTDFGDGVIYSEAARNSELVHITPVETIRPPESSQLPVTKNDRSSRRTDTKSCKVLSVAGLKHPELYYDAVDGIRLRSCPGKPVGCRKSEFFPKRGEQFWSTPLLSGAFRKLSPSKEHYVNRLVSIARSLLNECKNRSRMNFLNQICYRERWIVGDCVCCEKDTLSFVEHVLSADHLNRLIQSRMFPMKHHLERIIGVLDLVIYDEAALKHSLPFLHGTLDVEKQISDEVLLSTLSFQRTAISSYPNVIVIVVLEQEFEVPRTSKCPVCRKKIPLCEWISHLTSQQHLNELKQTGRRASIWDIKTLGIFIKRCERRLSLRHKSKKEIIDVNYMASIDDRKSQTWLDYVAKRCRKNTALGTQLSLYNTSIVGKKKSIPCESALGNECKEKNVKQHVERGNRSTTASSKESKKKQLDKHVTAKKKLVGPVMSRHQIQKMTESGLFFNRVEFDSVFGDVLFTGTSSVYDISAASDATDIVVTNGPTVKHGYASYKTHHVEFTPETKLTDILSRSNIFFREPVTFASNSPSRPAPSGKETVPRITHPLPLMDAYPRPWQDIWDSDYSSSESSSNEISQYTKPPDSIATEVDTAVSSAPLQPVNKQRLFLKRCRKQQNIPLLFGALKKSHFIGKAKMNELVDVARGLLVLCEMSSRKRKWLKQRCLREGWNVRRCAICRCMWNQSSYIEHVLSEDHLNKMLHNKIYPTRDDLECIVEALDM